MFPRKQFEFYILLEASTMRKHDNQIFRFAKDVKDVEIKQIT